MINLKVLFIFSVLCHALSSAFYTNKTLTPKIKLTKVLSDTSVNDSTSLFIPNQATPKLVSEQFSFTEGPATDRKGNIYFTDQPNNKIWKYDTSGKLTLFKNSAGRANGTYIDPKGNLIACADEIDQLWSITPKGNVTVVLKDFEGHRLNGPNDLWVNKKGDIYFTDPYYQRPYWTRTQPEIKGQKVYMLANKSKQPIIVADDLVKPNGIVGTPDGKYLFVSDIQGNRILKYTINSNGTLGNKTLFVAKGADGITLDERGNLYLAGNGVTIVNPAGKIIAHIAVPQPWTANLCFGGKHKNILFLTASKAVYILPMRVHGVE